MELFNTPLINDANLLAYYRFNNGALTTDSKNSYTLTNNNSVGNNSDGKFGYGADLGASNTNKYLSSTNTLGIDGGVISITMWLKLYAEPSSTTWVLAGQSNNSSKVYFYFTYDGTSLSFQRIKAGIGSQSTSGSVTLGTSRYRLVTGTYDGSYLRLYVDNSQVGTDKAASGNGNSTAPTTGINIGSNFGNANFTSAKYDDVAFFNKELTLTEIQELYTVYTGAFFNFM